MIDAIDIFFFVYWVNVVVTGDVSQLPTIKVFVLFIKRFFGIGKTMTMFGQWPIDMKLRG